MLEIRDDSVFEMKENAKVRNILGEMFFILDSESGKQYNLSEMEYEIVDMIKKGYNFGKTVDKIALEYNAEKELISKDLREYVISLCEAGLICAK